MSENYYIKEGRKYVCIGTEILPPLISDGLWLVNHERGSRQRILKLGDLMPTYPYGQMAQDINSLATILRALVSKYIDNTIRISTEGGLSYSFPSATEMAQDILRFLAMSEEERDAYIVKLFSQYSHIDDRGNVINLNGKLAHKSYSSEAIAIRIQDLKNQIKELETRLGESLVDKL